MLVVFSFKRWETENRDMRNSLAIQAGFAANSSQAEFDNLGASMEMLGELLKRQDAIAHPQAALPALMQYKTDHPEIAAMALIKPSGETFLNTAAVPGESLPDLRRFPDYYRSFLFDLNNTYSYNIGINRKRPAAPPVFLSNRSSSCDFQIGMAYENIGITA